MRRSLPAQLAECRRYAANRGWVIDTEFQDVMSGKREDRPEYQKLLARVRELRAEGKRAVVVVAWLHRLGRRVKERVNAWEECKALGVEIHAAVEGGLQNELVFNVLASVAQEESRQFGERVSTTWRNLNASGWFKVSSAVPWGYRARLATPEERASGSPRTVLDVDEIAAPYVRQAFERVARGESTLSVARWLADLPAEVRGSRYNGVNIKKPGKERTSTGTPRKLSWRTMQEMLRNQIYAGLVETRDETAASGWRRVKRQHAAVVDEATWQRVQDRLDVYRDAPTAMRHVRSRRCTHSWASFAARPVVVA